jgi:hypothetical protein
MPKRHSHFFGQERVISLDLHTNDRRAARHFAPDTAEANDTKGLL